LFTLFKTDDAKEIALFVEYYRGLGVDYFLLYLNGLLSDYPNIKALAERYGEEGAPVSFAEWNYPYRDEATRLHLAQVTAMHSALHRLRCFTSWLGYFDTDEFVIPSPPFYTLLERVSVLPKDSGILMFSNHFAIHPKDADTSRGQQFLFRQAIYDDTPDWGHSKFLIKPNMVQELNVHHPKKEYFTKSHKIRVEKSSSDYFLHFHSDHHNDYERVPYHSPKNTSLLRVDETDDYNTNENSLKE
jgi:hypothetical protein